MAVSILISYVFFGKSEAEAKIILNNLSYTTSKDFFKDCDLVVESIIENLKVKQSFYGEISKLVKDECILAANTSGLSINAIGEYVNKPERFIGMHWFNPSHLVLLIEIIKGDNTSDDAAKAIYDLSVTINKKPVKVNKDVMGFAANRIQFAVLREALYLIENGAVSMESIDDLMKYGLGFRYACLGPLEVVNFGGVDTFHHISEYLMKDLCSSPAVPALLDEVYKKAN